MKDAFGLFLSETNLKKQIIDRYVKLEIVICDLFDVSSQMLNITYQIIRAHRLLWLLPST